MLNKSNMLEELRKLAVSLGGKAEEINETEDGKFIIDNPELVKIFTEQLANSMKKNGSTDVEIANLIENEFNL